MRRGNQAFACLGAILLGSCGNVSDPLPSESSLTPRWATLSYGIYPQSNVKDEDTVSLLDSLGEATSNGWCLLDGEYYAKRKASPDRPDYAFDDGDPIVSGEEYWFKCEPILWDVLSSLEGERSLVSSFLLDARRYREKSYKGTDSEYYSSGHYANNYEESEIRGWLNNDFCSSAFCLDDSSLLATPINNQGSTTDYPSNAFACEDTVDKAYLPSYQDYLNADYLFSPDPYKSDLARRCKTTDWARASGTRCYSGSCGIYWARSPYSSYSSGVHLVSSEGSLYSGYVNVSYCSVRPAITIKAS